jgi:oxygen-dependent protoporphyrinogen oxidase
MVAARPDFTIVGGGVGGLVVARRLAMGGASVRVLEASDRLGGTMTSHTLAGIELDAGPESYATRGGTVAALATELGLAGDLVAPTGDSAWLQQTADRAVRLPATSRLGIPGVPMAADVIEAIGMRGAWRAQLDSVMPALEGKPDLTLGALVRRRMGNAVLDRLVAPVVLGVYSRHPDELLVDRVAPGLRQAVARRGGLAIAVREDEASVPGKAVGGIRSGIHRLAAELAKDLDIFGVDVRPRTRVSSLDEVGDDAGQVIVAAPGLLPESSTRGTPVTLVTLVTGAPGLTDDPRGSGILVAAEAQEGDRGIRAKALTHLTAKWPWLRESTGGLEVIRLSYAQRPELEQARLDAERLLGVELPARSILDSDLVDWSRAAQVAAPEGMVVVGEQVAGAGLASIIAQADAVARGLLDSRDPNASARMDG